MRLEVTIQGRGCSASFREHHHIEASRDRLHPGREWTTLITPYIGVADTVTHPVLAEARLPRGKESS